MNYRSRVFTLLLLCFYPIDAIEDMSGIIEDNRPIDYIYEPNSRYIDGESFGIWASASDVDKFFERYNHDNGYKSATIPLRLGDYVTIQDGTYNVQWMIAGFDMEHNQIAADGTTYNNGYGICFVPKTYVTTAAWNASDTVAGAYKSSAIHNTHLHNIVTKLQGVLGSHLIQRNVLLSSSVDGLYYRSNGYTWTTAYATLMSVGQMTGTFAANINKYDDGEANYKLPVFNYKGYATSSFWTRGIWGRNGDYWVWYAGGDGKFNGYGAKGIFGVRPLIYLR